MPNFTTEDLLRYMYNEMSKEEKADLEQQLRNNWALREKFRVLKESENSLRKFTLQGPRSKTLQAIMQYANHAHDVAATGATIEYLWVKGE